MSVTNSAFVCPICNRESEWPSEVVLRAHYGSVYDGNEYTLTLCDDCIDTLIESWTEDLKQEN